MVLLVQLRIYTSDGHVQLSAAIRHVARTWQPRAEIEQVSTGCVLKYLIERQVGITKLEAIRKVRAQVESLRSKMSGQIIGLSNVDIDIRHLGRITRKGTTARACCALSTVGRSRSAIFHNRSRS